MFDIGWQELLVIAVVALVVIGPKDLPKVLKTVMAAMGKLRQMAQEFRSNVDEVIKEQEWDELKRNLEKTATADINGKIKSQVDPTSQLKQELKTSLDIVKAEASVTSPKNNAHDR